VVSPPAMIYMGVDKHESEFVVTVIGISLALSDCFFLSFVFGWVFPSKYKGKSNLAM